MTLAWYLQRLRSMGSAEVLHRCSEIRRKILSRYADQGWHRYPALPMHVVFKNLRTAVDAATQDQRRAISAAAHQTLAGRFAALGQTWPQRSPDALFPAKLWRLDPVTGQEWPGNDIYTFKTGFRFRDLGDIKYVWEINRLQFLPPLAAQVLLDADEQGLVAIAAAIDSWHCANPPFSGVGWRSGIEVALRAISLILTLDLVGERLSDQTRRQVGEILSASCYWLPRFPSRFSSANNHIIAELAGTYLLSLSFGSPSAKARQGLADEIQKQILADGTGAEQTPTYAAFTAELMLLCAAAGRQSDTDFGSGVDARLTAFADFIDWLGPNAIGYGDDDEGRVVTLGSEADYAVSVAAGIRGYLGDIGLAAETSDFPALFFGRPTGSRPAREGLRSFEQGGLSIWRGEIGGRRVALTFDHGPLGYLAIAAHGHADALSVTLAIDGMPVLTDPGTWQYGAAGVWRDWFRSTPAHNTLSIGGYGQSVVAGPFNWSHKAVARLITRQEGTDWQIDAEHDGYNRRFGVVHRRRLEKRKNEIVVHDRLIGRQRRADIVFQLAIGLTTSCDGDTVTIERDGQALMRIRFPSSDISIQCGGQMPGQGGWVSPRFGVLKPADRLVWSGLVGDKGVVTRMLF